MANRPIRAFRVTPGGAISEVTLPPAAGDQLPALRGEIGCDLLEPVGLGDVTMWCDEEGFLVPTPQVNLCATGVAAARGRLEQPYVGTVVFTGAASGGDVTGLTQDQVADLRGACERVCRAAVMHRLSRPDSTVIDEVRVVQCECIEAGIGAR